LGELGQSVPGFNELPDETKLSMAKAVRSAKGPETLAPPGNPAGTGYSEAQMQTQAEEKAKKTKELMLRMFGGEAVAGSELFPSVTDIGSQFKTNGV